MMFRSFGASSVPPQPMQKPLCPNFGSGPCPKRPGFSPSSAYRDTPFGRSHRSKIGLSRIVESLRLTREILKIPKEYLVGIVPASDTGAVEMALWNLMGSRPVTSVFFDAFGKEWFTDLTSHLKLKVVRKLEAPYGELPDLSKVDFHSDVIFTWNGTTSGVRVPNGDWISDVRMGLTICDATSAVFAMEMPWKKLDVTTFSWQKVLGGEAAHGMIVLSPRAVKRLDTFTPPWPIPKILRLRKDKKVDMSIFSGEVINTVSMLCVEDYLDALKWSQKIGGLPALVKRSQDNLAAIDKFVKRNRWAEFLCRDPNIRSSTSVTLAIKDLPAESVLKMTAMLSDLKVAYDINSYRAAPPGIRIWCGATVETSDVERLCEWIEWSHSIVAQNISWKKRILVTDGISAAGKKELQSFGYDVVEKKLSVEELEKGALAAYDCVIIRSATNVKKRAIESAVAQKDCKLRIVARAGVGVDNVDVAAATECGIMVVNAPQSATRSVAELTLAHLLASVKELPPADRTMRKDKWLKSVLKGSELFGKRIGLVGYGRIGQTFGRMCESLGMEVHVFDPYQSKEALKQHAKVVVHDRIESLFRSCTHISIHCGLTPETRHLVNSRLIHLMPGKAPDGTACGNHIVNCARGGVLDEKACEEALHSGKLSTLALDVYEAEPLPKGHSILHHDGFHGTPHIGANSPEAQGRVGAEIVKAVIAALAGRPLRGNYVNPNVKLRP